MSRKYKTFQYCRTFIGKKPGVFHTISKNINKSNNNITEKHRID